jgi:Fe-S-cluster formation regulator IscX/YfhJ
MSEYRKVGGKIKGRDNVQREACKTVLGRGWYEKECGSGKVRRYREKTPDTDREVVNFIRDMGDRVCNLESMNDAIEVRLWKVEEGITKTITILIEIQKKLTA